MKPYIGTVSLTASVEPLIVALVAVAAVVLATFVVVHIGLRTWRPAGPGRVCVAASGSVSGSGAAIIRPPTLRRQDRRTETAGPGAGDWGCWAARGCAFPQPLVKPT